MLKFVQMPGTVFVAEHVMRLPGTETGGMFVLFGMFLFGISQSGFMAGWARMLPWCTVAKLFDCAWGTVASAVKVVVDYGLEHRDLSSITHIGIDEISRKKGHVYLTNVYDLHSKTLIWSGEGRTKENLRRFF